MSDSPLRRMLALSATTSTRTAAGRSPPVSTPTTPFSDAPEIAPDSRLSEKSEEMMKQLRFQVLPLLSSLSSPPFLSSFTSFSSGVESLLSHLTKFLWLGENWGGQANLCAAQKPVGTRVPCGISRDA